MSFFCKAAYHIDNLISKNQEIFIFVKKIITLQVRIPSKKSFLCRKRTFLFASASLTVEAGFVLPIFLFAGVLLMMPLRIMNVQRQVQAVMEDVSEELGQAVCLKSSVVWGGSEESAGEESVGEGSAREKTAGDEAQNTWTSTAALIYAETAIRIRLRDYPVEQLTLRRSHLLEDGATIDLIIDYEMKLPFSFLGLKNVKRTNRSFRRAWIGRDGWDGSSQETVNGPEQIVYVGRDSTRYHVSSSCHYLNNQLTRVALTQIGEYRNKNGGRYTPCSRCGKSVVGIVYITPSGEHYHSTSSCTAIQAYVSAVPLSQVEYLGACSYCSGGK